MATFQKSNFLKNPAWNLGVGFFVAALLPGLPLIFSPTYSTDSDYVYEFVGLFILVVIMLIASSIPWREDSGQIYPAARISLIIGILLGLATVSTITYVRFIRPLDLESVAGWVTEVRGKAVPVMGVVSSTGTEANKATYVLQGDSRQIFVVAKAGASSPPVGHRVWVLGWVGVDSAGNNFLFEHAREDLQLTCSPEISPSKM